jgi:hypothetical protein
MLASKIEIKPVGLFVHVAFDSKGELHREQMPIQRSPEKIKLLVLLQVCG